jgi:multidrug efflux pump subunit AcrA (membrane-fusion protein)
MLLLIVGSSVGYFFFVKKATRPDLILHTVKRENLEMTVVERGTLESSENREIVCRVKAGSRGSYASTIKWVIEDGKLVKKGQPIMILDSSALEDQHRAQKIVLGQAEAAMIAAEQNYLITINQNESDIASAMSNIELAELDLEKYVGLPRNTLRKLKQEEARRLLSEMEASLDSFLSRYQEQFPGMDGEYQQALGDMSGKIELAEADLEMCKDRLAYSKRMQLKGFLSPTQVAADQSRLESAQETLKKVRGERQLLQKFTSQRTIKDLSAKVQEAWRAYDRTIKQAHAKEIQAEAERRTKRNIYLKEEEKLNDIEDQIAECKIHAPQDGMVVYYVPESSRFGTTTQGMIQQGASVQEGQKMMRIPDLRKMQVATKVHEAMVAKIRPDDLRSTGFQDLLKASLWFNPSPMNRLLTFHESVLDTLQSKYLDYEYYLASKGQQATIRVDAFTDKVFTGRVRSVATVASQQDFSAADVKVYQTIVSIDEEVPGLRPGMSAEVTIQIDNTLQDVLTVPVQAILGGPESGKTRTVWVMTPEGPQPREIIVGQNNERMAEVVSGLNEGDQVIVNPKVIVGDKVKTREEPPAKGSRPKGNAPKDAANGSSKGKAKE